MSLFASLRARASQLFDFSIPDGIYSRPLSPDEAFRLKFRLPEPETAMHHVNVQLALVESGGPVVNTVYEGDLILSESFLAFDCDGDSRDCWFTLPLVAVRKVERLPSKSYLFALQIDLYAGHALIVNFIGMISGCEEFCAGLKQNLRSNLPLARRIRKVSSSFYSEFMNSYLEYNRLKLEAPEEAGEKPSPPEGGLGTTFGFPGDAKKLRDKSKTRLWLEYFAGHGRNITLIRQQGFYKLIRVGLPNRLRGEIREVCSGSMLCRVANPTLYASMLRSTKENTHWQSRRLKRILIDHCQSIRATSSQMASTGYVAC